MQPTSGDAARRLANALLAASRAQAQLLHHLREITSESRPLDRIEPLLRASDEAARRGIVLLSEKRALVESRARSVSEDGLLAARPNAPAYLASVTTRRDYDYFVELERSVAELRSAIVYAEAEWSAEEQAG